MHNVVPFPRDDDIVFFRKHQLRVGTLLWPHRPRRFVTGVYTTRNGRHVPRSEVFPQTLTDIIRLENHYTKKVMKFDYLSYSANR